MIMYNPNDPDFYEISKNISEYDQRKIDLGLKTKEKTKKITIYLPFIIPVSIEVIKF